MFYENFSKVKDIVYDNKKCNNFKCVDATKDSRVMDMDCSSLTYNFDYSKGVLVDGIGIGKLGFKYGNYDDYYKELDDFPSVYHPTVCWHFSLWATDFKTYRSVLFVLGSDGYIYYNLLRTHLTEFTKIEGLHFDDIPFVFSARVGNDDVLFFVSEANGTYMWMYPLSVNRINNMPLINSFCVHNNRCFATVNNNRGSVIYTNDLNPINFNLDLMQGGELVLDDRLGKCNKVVSFNGDLFVFRDFDIVKVTEYSSRGDFSLERVYASNGRIFDKTICVAGDKIIYLASDGIYKFDGNSVKRLLLNIVNLFEGVDNYYAIGSYVDGKYFLSCKLNYLDNGERLDSEWPKENTRNNALLKIDVATEQLMIFRGYDIVDLCVVNDVYCNEVCVRIRELGATYVLGKLDKSGAYFGLPLTKVWSSPVTDFANPDKYKFIKDISFETKKDIELEIVADMKTIKYKIKGSDSLQTIKLNLKCKKFGFVFISKEVGNCITCPKVKVGYYD